MKYKCVIFDCDGVLVDTETISYTVLIEMTKSLGLNINLDFAIKNFPGISLKSVFQYIEDRIGYNIPIDFEKEYREKTFAAFKNELKPIEGVHNLLDRLKVPFCVASGGPLEKIRLNLTIAKLLNKFTDNIFSSYEIGSWKPDPGIFLFAAEKMGYKPNECVVIEDSLAGVKAAQTGGFDVYVYIKGKKVFENTNVHFFYDMNNLDSLLKLK
jgi:HAD superfamily hydrolase (TIGR01509 family)